MRVDSVTLKIALLDVAPVDQLLWSAWGFCVLEAVSGGDLVLEGAAPNLSEALAAMGRDCGVAVLADDGIELAPSRHFAAVASAGVVSSALLRQAREVCVFPGGPLQTVAAEWFWDGDWMSGFRARVRTGARSVLGDKSGAPVYQALRRVTPWQPAVSLVSSVFKADRFLSHFLDNCAGLAGYREMEHWLVRPGSPGDEHAPLLAHARSWPGAVYLNLAQDPGLYATWNLACCLARGRYVSNANVDDRRHSQHTSQLCDVLHTESSVDVASSALRLTETSNLDWEHWKDEGFFFADGEDRQYGGANLIANQRGELRPHNIPHCMPLWRRGLHGLHGFFNETQYGPSADWEFWLRCSVQGAKFYHSVEPLGIYLKRADSYWRIDSTARRFDARILTQYGAHFECGDSKNAPKSMIWRELTCFLQTQNWFGVLISLARLNSKSTEMSRSDITTSKIATGYAHLYFSVPDFTSVSAESFKGAFTCVMTRLEPQLIQWFRSYLISALDRKETIAPLQHWTSALVDWYLLTTSTTPLIALALMERYAKNNLKREADVWRRIYRMDSDAFKSNFKIVYRDTLTVDEALCMVQNENVPKH